MKIPFEKLSAFIGKGRLFKILFNLSPMYRRTGGRLIEVSNDLQHVKIKLPLNYKTKNYVGTLYGGHMYGCTDGIYMLQLLNILGKNYVVWDKSASIRFRRPGNQTLFAEFEIKDEQIKDIKATIATEQQKDFTFGVTLRDRDGVVYAEIEKVIYIASKKFYRRRKKIQQCEKCGKCQTLNTMRAFSDSNILGLVMPDLSVP